MARDYSGCSYSCMFHTFLNQAFAVAWSNYWEKSAYVKLLELDHWPNTILQFFSFQRGVFPTLPRDAND